MPTLPGYSTQNRSLLALLIAIRTRIRTCWRRYRLRCWALRPRMLRLLGMPGAYDSAMTHCAAYSFAPGCLRAHLQTLLSSPVDSLRRPYVLRKRLSPIAIRIRTSISMHVLGYLFDVYGGLAPKLCDVLRVSFTVIPTACEHVHSIRSHPAPKLPS